MAALILHRQPSSLLVGKLEPKPHLAFQQPCDIPGATQHHWESVALAATTGLLAGATKSSIQRRARGRHHVALPAAAGVVDAKQSFTVSNGARLEVLGGPAVDGVASRAPALLLIHGSYHAAWCWEPHFLGYFRSQGYATYALSLRGQGTGTVPGELPAVAGTLEEHASDVEAFIQQIKEETGSPVIVLGHSFGGLIVQQTVLDLVRKGSDAVAGMVLLASVPPSGNGSLIWRYIVRNPILAVQITWGFVARAFENNAGLCKTLFFDEDMPAADVEKYMQKMKQGCPAGTRLLDLRELQKSLPVKAAAPGKLPVMVIGGEQDVIVDVEAMRETAEAHKCEPIVLPGVAHDAMLGPRWRDTADAILAWMEKL